MTDKELDTRITFLRVVRGLTPPPTAKALAGHEMVFVEVRIDAGKNYSNPVSEKEFLFGTKGGISSPAAERGAELDALKAAGHPRLGAVRSGTTGTGWIVGTISPASSAQALVTYRRLGGITDKRHRDPQQDLALPPPPPPEAAGQ